MTEVTDTKPFTDNVIIIEEKFFEMQKEMKQEAENFYLLITKIRSCMTDTDICKDIKSTCDSLTKKLKEIFEFDNVIQELQQTIISSKTECKRQYEKKVEQIRNFDEESNNIVIEKEQDLRQMYKLLDENAYDEISKKKLEEEKSRLAKLENFAWVGSFFAALLPPIFQPVKNVKDALTLGKQNVEAKLGAFDENIKEKEKSCEKLLENLKTRNAVLKNFCSNRKKNKMDLPILEDCEKKLTKLSPIIIQFTVIIQKWIEFLIFIEPAAKRIQKSHRMSDRALQRSITYFNEYVSSFNIHLTNSELDILTTPLC